MKETVQIELVKALKAKDETRLSTMRMLLSALNYARIDKMSDLTSDEEITVVRKEAKKRQDAIDFYENAGKMEQAAPEKAELVILQEFLPKAITKEELLLIVKEVMENGTPDFGRVMKEVMAKTKGAADGKVVSELVRAELNK